MSGMETAVSAAGVGTGVGATLVVRRELDQTGETTVFRPSVLFGAVTGGLALGASMMVDHRRSHVWEFVEDYGEAALTAALFSAFSPKGGGVALPSL